MDSKAEVKKMDAIDEACERLNQLGQVVRAVEWPKYKRRDWASEDVLDQFVGLYARNIAEHYHDILNGQHIECLTRLFTKDVPIAVVGAGPSLDKNVDLLKDFPGIILASDRAAVALTARGIDPDLVMAIDPRRAVIADYLNYPGHEKHTLVLSVCCDPAIAKNWHGKILYTTMHHPRTQFFDRILPELFPGMPGLSCLGNVGNTCVALADMMGCSPIVLVGQDYSYTDGKMHADNWCKPNGQWKRVEDDHAAKLANRTGKVEVDGVLTYGAFTLYRKTLEIIQSQYKLDIINATEGGILNNFPKKPLKEVTADLGGKNAWRKARTLLAKAIKGGSK